MLQQIPPMTEPNPADAKQVLINQIQQRATHPWLKTLIAGVMTLAALSSGITGWKWYKTEQARAQTAELNQQLLVENLAKQSKIAINLHSQLNGSPEQGLLLAALSYQLDSHSSVSHGALKDALQDFGWLGKIVDTQATSEKPLAFSLDSKLFLSINDHKQVQLWDAQTGKAVAKPWQAHDMLITAVALNADGSQAVIAGEDKTLQLWDTKTQAKVGAVWKLTDAESKPMRAVVFSSDGQRIVSLSDDHMYRLWEVKTGKILGRPWKSAGSAPLYPSMALNRDNSELVTLGGDDNHLDVWNITNPNEPKLISATWHNVPSQLQAVGFSGLGDYSVLSRQQALQHLTLLGDRLAPYTNQTVPLYSNSRFTSIALNETQGHIVTADQQHQLKHWDTSPLTTFGHLLSNNQEDVIKVAFSPDGKQLHSADYQGAIKSWNTQKLDESSTFSMHKQGEPMLGYSAFAFSADGKYVASAQADGMLQVWDLAKQQALGAAWKNHAAEFKTDTMVHLNDMQFSPDGNKLLTATSDKLLRLWDIKGQLIGEPWQGHAAAVRRIAFSPDGKQVASADEQGYVRLWDVATGKPSGEAWQAHKDLINSLAFSPDGSKLLTGSGDKTLQLWNMLTKQAIGKAWQADSVVSATAFSPDGLLVASGDTDNQVSLWDVATGQRIGQPWQWHDKDVNTLAFSPDNKQLAAGSLDDLVSLSTVDPAQWAKVICTRVNRNLTEAEWQQFVGKQAPYTKACPELAAPAISLTKAAATL